MSADKPHANYFMIWVVLVALVAVGALFLLIPSKTLAVVLIFAVATIKAILVVRHYMHVVNQPPMIYAMLAIPLIMAIALVFVLIPDIGHR